MSILRPGAEQTRIHWTPSMSVNIEKIDYQHKELLCLVNDLMDLVGEGKDSESFSMAFDFLEQYVVDHFGEEEKYMDMFSFPGAAVHKEQHALFRSTLTNLKERYEEFGATEAFLLTLQSQLAAWIMTHIKNVDTMLGKYLRDKNMDSPGESS